MVSKDDGEESLSHLSFMGILDLQAEKTGKLLDASQQIVKACRQQAVNWENIARAFIQCAEEAQDIAGTCSLAARVAVDRVGDIIATEFGIETVDDNDNEEDEDDDTNDE